MSTYLFLVCLDTSGDFLEALTQFMSFESLEFILCQDLASVLEIESACSISDDVLCRGR